MTYQRALAWCEVCGLKQEFDFKTAMQIIVFHKMGNHGYIGEKE